MWVNRALERSRDLQISAERLLAHYDLVCGALGPAWIEEQESKLTIGSRTVSDVHPLYRNLIASTDAAIVEICELAEYLKAFKDDSSLPQVVEDLKSPKFDPTFFELAMAYRWLNAGAPLRLRPSTLKGEADYAATINEMRFVVEASLFPADLFSEPGFRLAQIAADVVEATIHKHGPIALKVRIDSYPPGNSEEIFRHAVREICLLFDEEIKLGNAEIFKAFGFCSMEIEKIRDSTEQNPFQQDRYKRIVDAREHDWNIFFRIVTKGCPSGAPLYRVLDDDNETENGRIFMKFPRKEVNPYEKILKKLKKEAKQLGGVRGPRVILLDATGITNDIFDLRDYIGNQILSVLDNTPELASVWLMMRRWSTAFRFKYWGIHFQNPESVYQIPNSFLQKLFWNEWRWDFLSQREFSRLAEEEALRHYAEHAQ